MFTALLGSITSTDASIVPAAGAKPLSALAAVENPVELQGLDDVEDETAQDSSSGEAGNTPSYRFCCREISIGLPSLRMCRLCMSSWHACHHGMHGIGPVNPVLHGPPCIERGQCTHCHVACLQAALCTRTQLCRLRLWRMQSISLWSVCSGCCCATIHPLHSPPLS